MRTLLLLPLRILAIGTQAKSFEDPVLGNRVLNRLGLHALRTIVAHGAMRVRRALLAGRIGRDDRRAFARDGFVVKTGFLPPELFEEVVREAAELARGGDDSVQGDTRTRLAMLDDGILRTHPACRAALRTPAYGRLLGYVAGRLRVPFRWIQTIHSGEIPSAEPDPQRALHADTFQPSMKAWLFLTDADETTGAFTYVPGSHRLTLARLRWEYARSVRGGDQPDRLSVRGSARVREDELPALGLPPPCALAVPRNTLVVADTCGFHCRGPSRAGPAVRMEVWALCRTNPFNPLPGLPFAALDRLDVAMYRRFLDLRARARRRAEERRG